MFPWWIPWLVRSLILDILTSNSAKFSIRAENVDYNGHDTPDTSAQPMGQLGSRTNVTKTGVATTNTAIKFSPFTMAQVLSDVHSFDTNPFSTKHKSVRRTNQFSDNVLARIVPRSVPDWGKTPTKAPQIVPKSIPKGFEPPGVSSNLEFPFLPSLTSTFLISAESNISNNNFDKSVKISNNYFNGDRPKFWKVGTDSRKSGLTQNRHISHYISSHPTYSKIKIASDNPLLISFKDFEKFAMATETYRMSNSSSYLSPLGDFLPPGTKWEVKDTRREEMRDKGPSWNPREPLTSAAEVEAKSYDSERQKQLNLEYGNRKLGNISSNGPNAIADQNHPPNKTIMYFLSIDRAKKLSKRCAVKWNPFSVICNKKFRDNISDGTTTVQTKSISKSVRDKRIRKRSIDGYQSINPALTSDQSLNNINGGPGRRRGNQQAGSSRKGSKGTGADEKDEAGMGGSAVDSGSVSRAQKFATQPAPQTAVIGSTAVLPCRVTGKVGHLQWTKDGFGLGTDRDLYGFSRYAMIGSDDEGDFSLRMNPVMLQDDALYQCQVSASDGVPGIRSQPVRLTVYVPPDSPVVHPPIVNSTAGIPVSLFCESRGGRPPPEIQWVDNSRRETIQQGATDTLEILEDGKRSVVKSRLEFAPTRHHDNQTVSCVTSNQALSSPLTASILLRVFFPPEISLTSHPEQFLEGDDVTFHCDSVANPSRANFRWLQNARVISNETSRNLKLFNISRGYHQDSISCEVSNKVGTSKKTETIYVRYGPTFRTAPKDVMAEIGADVDLTCDVDSNPAASIIWLRLGSDKIIGSGAILRVKVSSSTAGQYRCIANVRGRDFEFPKLEGSVRVLVKGPPKIVSESEQQGRMGDTVNLECRTVSVPSPIRVTWTYKGRTIDINDPRYEVVEDERNENFRNILVIHDAESTDFGEYNCSVVNEYGVARKLIRLKEEKRIPVLLVVGSGSGIVLVAVIVVSLVFCNKKHATVKEGISGAEKDKPSPAVANQQPLANMYSASSETKLTAGPLRSPSFQRPFTEIKVSPLPSNRPYNEDCNSVAYPMRPMNGPTLELAQASENFENDYSSFIETSDPLCRRSSLTDLSIYSQTSVMAAPPVGANPDFCTIRRGPRASITSVRTNSPPILPSYQNGNGSLGMRSANGALQNMPSVLNRHSAYMSPAQTPYSPPPPPPYPRPTGHLDKCVTSPPFEKGPSQSGNHGNPGSKYIFSSEAMLKPGTLV